MSYNLFAVKNERPRINRESSTIAAMIHLYCRENHSGAGLCKECKKLLDYARKRLDKCPFQEGKTTCVKCPAHCYKPDMRERIRTVMRYSGPRMIYRHPIMAIQHLIDGQRKEPVSRKANRR
ncbi:nitrous oxide-stimulated promoter family protein [Chloroflexota bacterium]